MPLKLTAPVSDVPNTYNEWTVHVGDEAFELYDFDGNMVISGQNRYRWADGWHLLPHLESHQLGCLHSTLWPVRNPFRHSTTHSATGKRAWRRSPELEYWP